MKMSEKRTSAIAAKLVLLVLGTTVLISCGSSDAGSTRSAAQQGNGASGQASQSGSGGAPTVDVTRVISQRLSLTIQLPGEFTPYEAVAVYPKVTAFVRWIGVDRGSRVK